MKFPAGIHDLSELPDKFKDAPIGRRTEIVDVLLALPGSRVSGEGLVTIERQGYAIEISVGGDDVCTCIMFYVYGNGSAAAEDIQRAGECLSVRVWDINGSQFLDTAADPTTGFRRYAAYRDRVLKDAGADGTG